jgi:hypothetical protein
MSSRCRSVARITVRSIAAAMKWLGGTRPGSTQLPLLAVFGSRHIRCAAWPDGFKITSLYLQRMAANRRTKEGGTGLGMTLASPPMVSNRSRIQTLTAVLGAMETTYEEDACARGRAFNRCSHWRTSCCRADHWDAKQRSRSKRRAREQVGSSRKAATKSERSIQRR